MMNFVVTSLVFCAVLIHVTAKTATVACAPESFEGVEQCCKMPKLLPYEAFKDCYNELQKEAKAVVKQSQAIKKNSAPKKPAKRFGRAAAKTPRGALPGGPTCLMECVLKKQKMLTISGDLNIPLITSKFTEAADKTWTPIVKSAVSNCSSELAKIDVKSLPLLGIGNRACKYPPGMLMSCLRRYLALSCLGTNYFTNSGTCTNKVNDLKVCDPFSISAELSSSG